MVDFTNIKSQAVAPDKTREYSFDMLVGEPSVILAPMHDENPAYLDERLRLVSERAAEIAKAPKRKPGGITGDEIKKNMVDDRDYDRRLLASTCIKGWGANPPVDVKGKVPEFTPANALAFLEALPNYVLDPFRAYAQNIWNFVDRPESDPERDATTGE